MCGIAGFVGRGVGSDERAEAVSRMCQAMRYRGPDDCAVIARHEAALGTCRLAVFDPANGQQPALSPDGRWTLVFNGAIYNHRELRDELARAGWEFRTACDTEVLLAAFVHWGKCCLERLRGMFAFAIWDDVERSLFFARDAFGIKPLYYRNDGDRLVFASELNALVAGTGASAEIDPVSVADYLAWFAVPAPKTIYRGIFSLQPGESATFKSGTLEISRFWSFRTIPAAAACGSYAEFTQELRGRLEDTIRAHMLADVPVGAFISGGLDSAAIVGLMADIGGSTPRTFCIGFDESRYSEAEGAATIARHFGAQHHACTLTGRQVAQDIETLLASLDQPTGDGINTFYASKCAKAGGVTVALSGLGGDELFGGYPSFRDTPRIARWLPLWNRLPQDVRTGVAERLNRGDTRRRKLADVLQHASGVHHIAALQRRVFSQSTRQAMLNPELGAALPPFHPALPTLSSDVSEATTADIVSAWELRTYMADVLLRDSDVMSMRHSLELRVPFVDRPLIEWLWRQPAAFTKAAGKSALLESVRDLLPPEMSRHKKRGFTLPFAVWMKHDLRPFLEETFSDSSIDRSGMFSRGNVQQFWRGYLSGHDTREWSRVWTLAVLIAFANRRNGPGSQGAPARTCAPATPAAPAAPRSTLLMAPEIFASEGGIPRIMQVYLQALCDSGVPGDRVRLLALNDRPQDGQRVRESLKGRLERSAACSRSKSRFIREALALSKSCDTIICGHVRQLSIAWLARKLNPKLRYFLVAHGIEVWRSFSVAELTALRGAEKILCVSDYTRRELLKNCPLPESRAVVLHNALDPFFKIAPGRPLAECEPVILVVTRLTFADRYKGVETMIEAMPEILRAVPNARLRIVGRGDDMPRLTQLRDSLSLGSAVEFTGFVSDERLTEEMRTCRLFALPSKKEGFGLVFIEAMAHGRPCLGARAGGVPEVITPESGVLVEYGDIRGMAKAAVEALNRSWDEHLILARARGFSFPQFKARLSELLGH